MKQKPNKVSPKILQCNLQRIKKTWERGQQNLSMQSANGEKMLGCITLWHTREKTKEILCTKAMIQS